MLRTRWFRALALLACLGAMLYLVASLHLPSSQRLIFGIDKRSGAVRVVDNRVTFLPAHRYYRLSFDRRNDSAQGDGLIRIESQDQVPVTMSYRLRFAIASGDRLPDARTLIGDGWSIWVGRRIAQAVDAFTRRIPVEDLLAPNSPFNRQREPLRRAVAAYLGKSGLKVTGFEIMRLEADRAAWLKVKRAEIRRNARSGAGRVAIFAIDGADWDLLSELSNAGVIPNLSAISKSGATASMQSIQPNVSPVLWTTVATGLPPDRHGVVDFFDAQRTTPVDSSSRRSPALWDIAEAFGRHSMAVSWWTGWPPTSADSVFFDTPVVFLPDAIYPSVAEASAKQVVVPLQTVGYDQVRPFFDLTPAEYEQAIASNNPRDPVKAFRSVLAKTWSDHRFAIGFYREQKPLLFMMDYSGADTVNHLFAPYHPPLREGVNSDSYRKFSPVVSKYYAEIDRMIGEWMRVLPPDTTVIVMSAHGFTWGKDRPLPAPAGGSASGDRSRPGIFIAHGNHVAAGRGANPVSVYDIAPAVLAILGLPQSADMPGHLPTWVFRDVSPVQSIRVVSYAEFLSPRPLSVQATLTASQYQAELQTVGHLSDPRGAPLLEDQNQTATSKPLPPDQWGAYAWYNNLGVQLRKAGKAREAADAFGRAIELNPRRATPRINLAITLMDQQQYAAADDAFDQAVANGLPDADRWFLDFAALYLERGLPGRAVTLLYKGKQLFPQSYEIAVNLGSALAAMDRRAEGLAELERALGLQPASTLTLNNIGTCYAKTKDYARALDFWNRSLSLDPHQPQIRAAAEAARSRV